MASTIKLKNGSGAPLAGDLVQGEPALDLTNKRLYTKDSGGNVIEVGVNPAAKIVANAGIALPDNQKATFGASDDLQIYHDVSNSVIKDAGTGNLVIMANNLLINNAASSQQMIGAADGGAVTLFNAGNLKLSTTSTGVDVTGTVTADHFKHGNVTTTATSKTIVAGEFCNVTAATQTITLPASPSAGDTVKIGVNSFTDTTVARNGSNIMSLAENLTIDKANVLLTLTYVDSTIGWRIY